MPPLEKLIFALKRVALQCQRLLSEIQHEISKELFRNLIYDLFNLLRTPRQRLIAQRQIVILKILLSVESIEWRELMKQLMPTYKRLKNAIKAMVRDVNNLSNLGAITVEEFGERQFRLKVRLEWPTEITESAFFEKLRKLPKAKSHSFLQ